MFHVSNTCNVRDSCLHESYFNKLIIELKRTEFSVKFKVALHILNSKFLSNLVCEEEGGIGGGKKN